MDNEIMELQRQVAEKQEQQKQQISIAHDEILAQYEQEKQGLSKSEDFKKITHEIVERGAKAELAGDMLKILTEEQKNELSAYVLECEKQKLNYRKKKEKGIIVEEVKAEISNKKIEALKKRYGYLYEQDENGNPKNFIANKLVNKYKEFCNWWEGTSDGFKKIVKGILKVVFWGGLAFLVVMIGYRGIMWIAENTKNLPNIQ